MSTLRPEPPPPPGRGVPAPQPGPALSEEEIARTAAWIASGQIANGMVPWYRGGHADPWNHMEAAMALAAAGRWSEVGRAFDWLAANQLADGSWCTFYLPDGVVEPRRDPNVCAYVATGAWWCSQLGGGHGLLETVWPMVEAAISWCLRYQRQGGEIIWSVGPDGVAGTFALLAANSSVQLSLRCAARVAEALGHGAEAWWAAAQRVAAAVAGRPADFAPKRRWAMDWYYPVLTGAVVGAGAQRLMAARWEDFVAPGLGVRCTADKFWVTAAETAECAMAAARAGLRAEAEQLLAWSRHLRDDDGAYWTGCAHPDCVRWPGGQQSTYSAAAVVIADHVLYRRSPAAAIFSARGGPGEPSVRGAQAAGDGDGHGDGDGDGAGNGSSRAALSSSLAASRPEAMQAGTPTRP